MVIFLFILNFRETFEDPLPINDEYLAIAANKVINLSDEDLDKYYIGEDKTQLNKFKKNRNIDDLFGMSFKDVMIDISFGSYDIDEPELNTNDIPLLYNNDFRNLLICAYLSGYEGDIPEEEPMKLILLGYNIDNCNGIPLNAETDITADETTSTNKTADTTTSTNKTTGTSTSTNKTADTTTSTNKTADDTTSTNKTTGTSTSTNKTTDATTSTNKTSDATTSTNKIADATTSTNKTTDTSTSTNKTAGTSTSTNKTTDVVTSTKSNIQNTQPYYTRATTKSTILAQNKYQPKNRNIKSNKQSLSLFEYINNISLFSIIFLIFAKILYLKIK